MPFAEVTDSLLEGSGGEIEIVTCAACAAVDDCDHSLANGALDSDLPATRARSIKADLGDGRDYIAVAVISPAGAEGGMESGGPSLGRRGLGVGGMRRSEGEGGQGENLGNGGDLLRCGWLFEVLFRLRVVLAGKSALGTLAGPKDPFYTPSSRASWLHTVGHHGRRHGSR